MQWDLFCTDAIGVPYTRIIVCFNQVLVYFYSYKTYRSYMYM